MRVVWLDLKNAFGSVPHQTMWSMMEALDVPSHFTTICREIYSASTQKVRSKDRYTKPMKINRGIKQGCPLSPLLFNLVLEGILPQVERMDGGCVFHNGTSVRILAYADDICVIGKTKEEINEVISKIHHFTQWAGLSLILIHLCVARSL